MAPVRSGAVRIEQVCRAEFTVTLPNAKLMTEQCIPANWRDAPTIAGFLDAGESHEVYWRAFGHPDALPVIALHGGPGSGSNARHLMFFDPQIHRVVMFDQRGSGQSKPAGATLGNTTQNLLEDTEQLRRHLGIERWLVFGLSWGACLALLYGQIHSRSCTGLVLAGLSNRHVHQTSWILEKRAGILPIRHAAFLAALGSTEREDPIAALYKKSLSADRKEQLEATRAVWTLEAGLGGHKPVALSEIVREEVDENTINRAKLYLHYWANKTFLPHGHLLVNPSALNDMPLTLVHGSSDWICPLSGARLVADALTGANLIVVPREGHSPYGAAMARVLRETVVALS